MENIDKSDWTSSSLHYFNPKMKSMLIKEYDDLPDGTCEVKEYGHLKEYVFNEVRKVGDNVYHCGPILVHRYECMHTIDNSDNVHVITLYVEHSDIEDAFHLIRDWNASIMTVDEWKSYNS